MASKDDDDDDYDEVVAFKAFVCVFTPPAELDEV